MDAEQYADLTNNSDADALDAINAILDLYRRVATGETRGAGGSFYADGKGTLNALHVPIELIEKLARASGVQVHPRTLDYRRGV